MMIFSGESGLGKSYAAFLVHYLYYVLLDSDRFLNFFLEQGYDFNEIYKKKEPGKVILSISAQEVLDWLNKDAVSYIGYLVGYQNIDGDINIKLPIQEKSFDFIFAQTLEGLEGQEELYDKIVLKDYSYSVVSSRNIPTPIPYAALIKAYFRELIFGDMNNITKTFLLPPSRGSLMEVSERPTFQSGMYEEFFDMKALLNKPQESVSPLNQVLIECNARVNNGELKREGEKYLYHMRNGATIPLTAAASSIKELSPLSLLINKFSVKGVSILFEEPEAHLHPSRQVKLADLLACIISAGGQLQVTTHSDYLIKRLNNLMNLLPNYRKDDYEVIGFIFSRPKKELRDFYKQGLLSSKNREANFVRKLCYTKESSYKLTTKECPEIKDLKLGENVLFDTLKLHHIAVAAPNETYRLDVQQYIS